MTAALDLLTARTRAESLMTSTCTVRANDANPVTDPVTFEVVPGQGTLIYSGKCRVRPASAGANSRTATAGGAETFEFDYLISAPFAEADIREGHLLTVTASPDPALVGITVEIQKVDRGDNITARRLFCSEVA